MRRVITALLVSATLAGSSGAIAQGWHKHQQGGGGDNANQGGQGGGGSGQGGGGSGQGGGGSGQGGSWQHGHGGSGGGNGPKWRQGQGGGDHGDRHGQDWGGQGNKWKGRGDHDNGQWRGDRHGGKWNDKWRSDRRYDWRFLRNRDRGRFHLPSYRAPHGYGYRRFYRGGLLNRFFFAQDYWFDAAEYGLPPAYGPYRWVRYFNDALLVNIYTGEVEDVIYDFFW